MDRKARQKAFERFADLLLQPGVSESEFQRLFSEYPRILSDSLPLSLQPSEIIPQGRPGRSEADFIIYPDVDRSPILYGAIELKRPDHRIFVPKRKRVLTLSSQANTAFAQAVKYARDVARKIADLNLPAFALGTEMYSFVIIGRNRELMEAVTSPALAEEARAMLPRGSYLIPYDTLLKSFGKTVPPKTYILLPCSPGPVRGAVVADLLQRARALVEDLNSAVQNRRWLNVNYWDVDSDAGLEGAFEEIYRCQGLLASIYRAGTEAKLVEIGRELTELEERNLGAGGMESLADAVFDDGGSG